MSISAKCDFCGRPVIVTRDGDSTISLPLWQHEARDTQRPLEACDRCNSKLTEMYRNVARQYFDTYRKLRDDRV